MISHFKIAAIVALAMTEISSSPAYADIVFSDNFNTEDGGVGKLNYTGFINWNVTQGSVDIIGNGLSDYLPGNGLYVDMDGSTGQAGAIQTKQTFAPGTYTLSFDLAGSQMGPDGKITVRFGSLDQTIDLASNVGFTLETFVVTITDPSGDKLSITSLTPGNSGALLDNVVLATVPEPTSVALLGVGLFGIGLVRRRRRV